MRVLATALLKIDAAGNPIVTQEAVSVEPGSNEQKIDGYKYKEVI